MHGQDAAICISDVVADAPQSIRRWAKRILSTYPEEDQEQERLRLIHLVRSLEALSASIRDVDGRERRDEGGGWQHEAPKLVNALRCCTNLKRWSLLKQTLTQGVAALLPPAWASTCHEIMRNSLPSTSTLSKSQAVLDAAMLLQFREQFDSLKSCFVYAWADASPHARLGELFQSEFMIVLKDGAVECLRQSWEYARLGIIFPPDSDSAEDNDRWEAFDEALARRQELFNSLSGAMWTHTNFPQILGSGMTDLASKSRLLLYTLWLTVGPPRAQALLSACDNICSFTTDMGTELGLADFQAESLFNVLPHWLGGQVRGERLQVDDGLGAEEDTSHVVDGPRRIFPHALVVSGMQHVMHNLQWFADESLPHFSWFLEK